MSTDDSSFPSPLELRKRWEKLAQNDQSENGGNTSNNGDTVVNSFGNGNGYNINNSDSSNTTNSSSSNTFPKKLHAVNSSDSKFDTQKYSNNTISSTSPKSLQPLSEKPIFAKSTQDLPTEPSSDTKPKLTGIATKPKPVISKKPVHLTINSSDSSTSLNPAKISKPVPIPPSRSLGQKVPPQPPSSSSSSTISSKLSKSEIKTEAAKKPAPKVPERKAFAPPPAVPPKNINLSGLNTKPNIASLSLNSKTTEISTNDVAAKELASPPPVPFSTHPIKPKASQDSSSADPSLHFIKPSDTRSQSAVSESFPHFNGYNDKKEDGKRVSTVPTAFHSSSVTYLSSALSPDGQTSTQPRSASLMVPPPAPPSRPRTPIISSFKAENGHTEPVTPKPSFVPPPLIPSATGDANHIPVNIIPATAINNHLPDPASFLSPPKHFSIKNGSQTPDPYSSKPEAPLTHKRGSSYNVATSESSKFAPPPPIPLHHPKPSTPISNGFGYTLGSEIKPPVSPLAPPPPPARKLKSPSSNMSLRDEPQSSTSNNNVPIPSVNSVEIQAASNMLAVPVTPIVPMIPSPVNRISTTPIIPTAPSPIAPVTLAHPVPVTAYPSAPPSIPPAHPGTLPLPVASAVPLSSPSFMNPSLPDPASFPPPPQRNDYFGPPPRRVSEASIASTQSSLVPPPPNRRGTSVSTLGSLQLDNNSSASVNSVDNHSSEDGALDSDEGSPLAPSTLAAEASYPDFSQANRRAPIFGGPMHEISSRGKVDAIGFYGSTVCISSSSTSMALDILTGERFWTMSHSDTRITAIEFKPEKDPAMCGRIVWLGTKEGHLWEVDIYASEVRQKRVNVHMFPVVAIQAVGDILWTVSEDGKICVWDQYINDTPKVFRMTPHFKAWCIVDDHIWVGKNRQVSAYHPSLSPHDVFNISSRPIQCIPLPPGKTGGEFTCAACVQKYPDFVFFGHDDGTITVFSRSKGIVLESISLAINKISSLAGVGSHLWIGTHSGTIYVADVSVKPWRIVKEWKAHETSVRAIVSNEKSFFSSPHMSHMPVISVGSEQGMLIWDGLLKTDWIENDMHQHDSEFCTFDDISTLYVTWNAGAARPSDLDRTDHDRMFLSSAFNRACPNYQEGPEIIVFGFQELVELDNKSVTAKTMFKSKKDKKEKHQKIATSTHISHQYKDWQNRLGCEIAAYFADNYNLVHSSNMVGLFTCVFVKSGEASRVRSIKSGKTKTGLGGFHGNKGGIAVRLLVDDSSICFVNCHLAAGQNHTLHRNKDIETILETPFLHDSDNTKYIGKGVFANGGNGVMVLDHEFCFFAGDMNYRINLHRPTALQMIQENEYARLLDADQLIAQLKKNPSHRLRAFQEAKINFAPTYKFDVGTDTYDTSEKRRVPAWCDRIYYRGRDARVSTEDYGSLAVRVSDHKPVMGLYKLKVKTIDPALRKEVYKDSLDRWQEHLNGFVTDLAQYYKVFYR